MRFLVREMVVASYAKYLQMLIVVLGWNEACISCLEDLAGGSTLLKCVILFFIMHISVLRREVLM